MTHAACFFFSSSSLFPFFSRVRVCAPRPPARAIGGTSLGPAGPDQMRDSSSLFFLLFFFFFLSSFTCECVLLASGPPLAAAAYLRSLAAAWLPCARAVSGIFRGRAGPRAGLDGCVTPAAGVVFVGVCARVCARCLHPGHPNPRNCSTSATSRTSQTRATESPDTTHHGTWPHNNCIHLPYPSPALWEFHQPFLFQSPSLRRSYLHA